MNIIPFPSTIKVSDCSISKAATQAPIRIERSMIYLSKFFERFYNLFIGEFIKINPIYTIASQTPRLSSPHILGLNCFWILNFTLCC